MPKRTRRKIYKKNYYNMQSKARYDNLDEQNFFFCEAIRPH